MLKRVIKKIIDSLFCKVIDSKKKIGSVDSWHIICDNLMNTVCYSGGVGKDITFETEIAEKYNCEVYLFDPSPTGIETAKNNKPNFWGISRKTMSTLKRCINFAISANLIKLLR